MYQTRVERNIVAFGIYKTNHTQTARNAKVSDRLGMVSYFLSLQPFDEIIRPTFSFLLPVCSQSSSEQHAVSVVVFSQAEWKHTHIPFKLYGMDQSIGSCPVLLSFWSLCHRPSPRESRQGITQSLVNAHGPSRTHSHMSIEKSWSWDSNTLSVPSIIHRKECF